MLFCLFSARLVVVAPIQAQVLLGGAIGFVLRFVLGFVLRFVLRFVLDQRGVEQLAQLLHVVPIGSRDHNRQRHTGSIGQEVALGAALAAVGGVAPGGLRLSLDPFFGRAP